MRVLALPLVLLLTDPKPIQFVGVEPVAEALLRRGASLEIPVSFRIRAGYHVQANPVEDPNLIPTTLSVEKERGLEMGASLYPKAQRFSLEGVGDIPTFDGRLIIRVPVKALISARPGLHRLRASLRYQACDARSCLAPRTLAFEIPVRIEKGNSAPPP